MTILSHVPPPWKPRPLQTAVLDEAHAAFESGKRFVIVEAPTGTGKSLIAATLARSIGDAYICTLTKQLQNQYLDMFHDIGARELKGKSSYHCDRAGATCETGSERFKEHNRCNPCPYRIAKAAAFAAPMAVCNYASYMWNVTGMQGGVRPFLVCDEAHLAEEVLLSHISVSVDATALPIQVEAPVPHASDTEACFDWLVEFLLAASSTNPQELSEKAKKEFDRLVKKATYALELRHQERWISESMDRRTGFVLKPLTVRSFGERLFRYGEKVLLMSATILDPESVADSLGIEDYAYVQAPCPFPKENRPVVVGSLDMTKKARGNSWPAMVQQVEAIMEGHDKEKGLLLTPSIEMMKYIVENLHISQQKRLILAYGADRMTAYQRHLDSEEPTVLAAPGLWEGADLKGDYSRFQIVPAVPRPFWGGQIAARAKMDPKWYRLQGMSQLIQGLGRSVRSESDSAVSYVLDVDLRNEARRSDSLLPEWFLEALEFT